MNSVVRKSAREIAANVPNPTSIAVSTVVVVIVDVSISGSCVASAVQVVALISVIVE